MKYLVIETHLSYAIVLNSQGDFLKVANFNYEEGQTVDEVLIMNEPEKKKTILSFNSFMPLMAAAASFLIIALATWQMLFVSVGAIGIDINPSVVMEVNRLDRVSSLRGLNEDGLRLVEGVSFWGKPYDELSGTLTEKAMELDMLSEGSQVRVHLLKGSDGWSHEAFNKISQRITETITIEIDILRDDEIAPIEIPITPQPTEPTIQEIIPVPDVIKPPEPTPAPAPQAPLDDSDYDDYTDYDEPRDYDDTYEMDEDDSDYDDYDDDSSYDSSDYD